MRGTSGSLIVNGGAIYINSAHSSAATASGHPTIEADEILIHGGADSKFDAVDFDREIYEHVDAIADPLLSLPEPNFVSSVSLPPVTVANTTTYLPGYHGSNISQNATNSTLVFAPGVHIINGALNVTGGNVIGNGVMLFIGPNGSIDLGGNGNITLSPISSLTYPLGPTIPASLIGSNVVLFQDRQNTRTARLRGGNGMSLDGRIYMPGNHLDISGGPDALGTGMIVRTIQFNGTSDMVINADPFLIPQYRFVFLVE
jgi:hypothetical protein